MNLWHALLTVGAYVVAPELVDEIEAAEDVVGQLAASWKPAATTTQACTAGCG